MIGDILLFMFHNSLYGSPSEISFHIGISEVECWTRMRWMAQREPKLISCFPSGVFYLEPSGYEAAEEMASI